MRNNLNEYNPPRKHDHTHGHPPCTNQDSFNHALRKALKYNTKQNEPKNWVVIVSICLYIFFFVWAIMLASKIPVGPHKVVHMTLAIVFSPLYVLAYYFGVNNPN